MNFYQDTPDNNRARHCMMARTRAQTLGYQAGVVYLEQYPDHYLFQLACCAPGTARAAMMSIILQGYRR